MELKEFLPTQIDQAHAGNQIHGKPQMEIFTYLEELLLNYFVTMCGSMMERIGLGFLVELLDFMETKEKQPMQLFLQLVLVLMDGMTGNFSGYLVEVETMQHFSTTCGNLILRIGLGFQEVILPIPFANMEQREFQMKIILLEEDIMGFR